MASIKDKAAIVGIGATEFSKNSGRSELQLAVEATLAALDDAGIHPSEVDGISSVTFDNSYEQELARNIGSNELKFFSRIGSGGGSAIAPLHQAAMAVTTGTADVVVCLRAMNERSGERFGAPGQAQGSGTVPGSGALLFAYHGFSGIYTAAAYAALSMRRYMHETGTTSDDFANYSLAARRHAATNPNAFFYQRPLTRDEYHNARMVADPFRLFDCCQESDGGVAVIVTSAERARSLRHKPALIRAAAQGSPKNVMAMSNYYREDISPREECEATARQLYAISGLTPKDVQIAILYDHFGPTILPALEGYGFCGRGEAKDFIRNGNIEIGGSLPVNTHGGQIGEAYIHGMNGVAEAVRQIRGTAVNQVANVENVLVTGGNCLPTSAILLGS
jgi:acetyl-CoA acetyltransferase